MAFVLFAAVLAAAAGLYLQSVRRHEATYNAVYQAGGAAYLSHQIVDGALDAAAAPEVPTWLSGWLKPRHVHAIAFVDFRGVQFGDEHLELLGGAPWLEWLALSDSQVTDEGVRTLIANHPHLERLEIDGTQVTDDGLASLSKLKSLNWVSLDGTHITPEGVAALQAALPYCRIDTGGPLVSPTAESE